MNLNKSILVSFFTLVIVFLTAVGTGCVVQTGDDGSNPPDASVGTPDAPDTDECQVDSDCTPIDGCSLATCDHGACRNDAACDATEVCDETQDACVPATTLPTTHGISCSQSGSTLYLTISGKLTDAVYGGTLTAPTHVSIASDAIAGSWNTTTLSTTYQVALSSNETSLGGVISKTITVPSNLAQRFTLLAWPSNGSAVRLDLSKWSVSSTTGDDCARIADGGGETSTSDGDVIGRAPLCANACSDGNDSTADACLATGCDHGGTTNPGNGTISCSESGGQTLVTVSNGILAHVFNQNGFTAASLRFGYGLPDYEPWTSDTTYTLSMPGMTSEFNLFVRDTSGVDHWFDVTQFSVSGTCSVGSGAFLHVPQSSAAHGSISCAESGTDTLVTISNGILAHVFNQNGFTAASLRFGYGLSDYEPWTSDTTYTLSMPGTTTVFNLYVRDTAGLDHWFDVNQFDATGTCSRGTNEFAHAATTIPVGNGTITCSVSGPDLTVSISGGILAHLLGTAVTPNSTWKIEYASVANPNMPYTSGKALASWVSDTWTYTLTMSSSEQGIQPALTDLNGYRWLDLTEYNVSGAGCYVSNGKIYH